MHVVEKERYNSSTNNVLVTCNALIKSSVSPEGQMLLNSLSTVGMYGIPIPCFIIVYLQFNDIREVLFQ